MSAIRRAEVTWTGDIATGVASCPPARAGRSRTCPCPWAARTEAPEGKTSPEELVAAAHASCFAMAFSVGLGRNGTPPERLAISADVTFDKLDAGWRVVSSALTVRGRVPGISAAEFAASPRRRKMAAPSARRSRATSPSASTPRSTTDRAGHRGGRPSPRPPLLPMTIGWVKLPGGPGTLGA